MGENKPKTFLDTLNEILNKAIAKGWVSMADLMRSSDCLIEAIKNDAEVMKEFE